VFLQQSSASAQSGVSLIEMTPGGTRQREIALCGAHSCAPSPPQWSPDGTAIVYATGYAETAQIHLVDTATAAVIGVPAGGNPDCIGAVEPYWSPDARQISFIGGPRRTSNLCVVPRAGGTPQVLIRHLAGYELTSGSGFSWLPAGAIDMSAATPSATATSSPEQIPPPPGTIVFASSNGSPQEEDGLEIWSMRSDGSEPRRLTSGLSATSPSISPDGSAIAFIRAGNVWVMHPDGSGAHQVSNLGGDAGDPVWSPDGSLLAFRLSQGRDHAPDGIYVMRAGGSNPHLVVAGNTFGQTWSPDGREIIYSAEAHAGSGLHLNAVDPTTEVVHRFLDLPGDQDAPVFSPDGAHLAFAWTTTAGSGLYLVNADGSNLRRVVGAPFTAGDRGLGITWSPDGGWLAFEGIEDSHGPQIYAIRSDGTGLQRLSNQRGFIPGTSIYGVTGTPSWGAK
jgi:Tol biopolymer transport system component